MHPSTERTPPAAQLEQPVSKGRLPVITYGTEEFRERSVELLASACARSPVCRILPLDVIGVVRFAEVDAILRNPLGYSS
ncbi:MAG: hypothetical protein K0S65_4925, partial [Labilithrix sp.]|nr:hypothetical protein [Labilithrix sp.]